MAQKPVTFWPFLAIIFFVFAAILANTFTDIDINLSYLIIITSAIYIKLWQD